jgi:hypothetical protein
MNQGFLLLFILSVFANVIDGTIIETPINPWMKSACIPENIKVISEFIKFSLGKVRLG